MMGFRLTSNEIERIQRAAEAVGFPWQPIVERPRTARRFLKRVEAELARRAERPACARDTGPDCYERGLAAA
jgi:hypothetical protein